MCDDKIFPEKSERDQSIKDYFHFPHKSTHEMSTVMYPKANLYYALSEDVHPMERIVTAVKFLEEEKLRPHEEEPAVRNPYSEDEATNRYLRGDPPSFVIFGKPGLNRADVASAIADAWNCALISPVSLIRREIDADTATGRDIERTLRLGRSVGPEVVADLIQRRVKTRDIRHRGFVVDCLPFIPDILDSDYSVCSTSDSSARRTCPEVCEDAAPVIPEDWIATSCARQFDYEREIPRQIDEMFTAWPVKPLIIVYLVCPRRDLASKCARVDVSTGDTLEDEAATRLDEEKSDRSQTSDEQLSVRDDGRSVRRTSDQGRNVEARCDLYERLALPAIDKWVLAHDPQRVIRVDGRDSARQILRSLETRLHQLAVQPSIVPKSMINRSLGTRAETSPGTSVDELAGKSVEEAFEVLRRWDVVSPRFPWRLSAWRFRCPVELARGRSVEGHPEHAVRFLGRLYFLSSGEAERLFVENPRSFLSPPNPRPVCRVAVFGPRYAGKSELCARLAKALGGTAISVSEISRREDAPARRADAIVRRVREVPDEELEDELRRDGGYVVDGMCADAEVWRAVVGADVAFEDVVLLYEDEPYTYLLSKFRGFSRPRDPAQEAEHEEDYGTSREDAEWEYLEHLTQFESEWTKLEEQIPELRRIAVKCNLSDIEDAAEYVINHIKLRFGIETLVEKKRDEKILEESAENEARAADASAEEGEGKYPARIDFEIAERLLDCGYYFLSPFGRWCPVQVHTGEINIQMFLPMRACGQIFPVACPPYIYFLAGEGALIAFLNDPPRYLERIFRPALVPLRIAVVGPPRCGKTTLASRFATTYGTRTITREKALRCMLKRYPWTESARTAEDHLRAGRPAPIESVVRAIEMIAVGSSRSTTQGFVLDGCPSSRGEAERLIVLGVQPMIVLDLRADLDFCLQCLARDDTSRLLDFSPSLLAQRYATWQADQAEFRNWLKGFSRNLIQLDATRSKWHVWTRADQAVRFRFADIALYFREANLDKVHSLRHMCVSPYEFRSRQSKYESYCPVCLFRDDVLKTPGRVADSQGAVQFREHFYWICPRHMKAFVENPLLHLPPVNTASLPDELPVKLEVTVDVEHSCWARRLRGDGFCLVTYVDGLPDRALTRGRPDLGVVLGDGVYLFCSEECREKFLARHSKYSEAAVELSREVSAIEARSLPDVEFLKRTVTGALIEAVNHVAARRPKLVGLSAAASAAICIGVYLKTRDAKASPVEAGLYEAASRRMAVQNRLVEIATDTVKKKPNPYAQASPNNSA